MPCLHYWCWDIFVLIPPASATVSLALSCWVIRDAEIFLCWLHRRQQQWAWHSPLEVFLCWVCWHQQWSPWYSLAELFLMLRYVCAKPAGVSSSLRGTRSTAELPRCWLTLMLNPLASTAPELSIALRPATCTSNYRQTNHLTLETLWRMCKSM